MNPQLVFCKLMVAVTAIGVFGTLYLFLREPDIIKAACLLIDFVFLLLQFCIHAGLSRLSNPTKGERHD